MFNLIANAMFEATRLPAPSDRPVRNRWFAKRADGFSSRSERRSEPSRSDRAAVARAGIDTQR